MSAGGDPVWDPCATARLPPRTLSPRAGVHFRRFVGAVAVPERGVLGYRSGSAPPRAPSAPGRLVPTLPGRGKSCALSEPPPANWFGVGPSGASVTCASSRLPEP